MTRLKNGIVLVGFMGAGKTTVGLALASRLKWGFIDLDKILEMRAGRSAAAIIATMGESFFRDLEAAALKDVLAGAPRAVVALGGGTWTIKENRDLIRQSDSLTIWLDTEFDLCWERIQISGEERPLAVNEAQARTLFESRRELYADADLTYRCSDSEQPGEIASTLIEIIQNESTGELIG